MASAAIRVVAGTREGTIVLPFGYTKAQAAGAAQ
jgi:hypothetical protein